MAEICLMEHIIALLDLKTIMGGITRTIIRYTFLVLIVAQKTTMTIGHQKKKRTTPSHPV